MIKALQEIFWVARYEVGEAMRTRLFQMGLLAWLGGLGAFNGLLLVILSHLENEAADLMGVAHTWRPGAMLAQLQADGKLDEFAEILGGEGRASSLLRDPLLGLWSSGFSMALLPILALFVTSASISSEVQSRAIRYLACRTDRLRIALGKLLGQIGFLGISLLCGCVLTWVMGMTLMVKVPAWGLAMALVYRIPAIVAFSLPFVGLGMASSQLSSSPNGARFVSLLLFFGLFVVSAILPNYVGIDTLGRLADLALLLSPFTTWQPLWSDNASENIQAALRAAAIAVGVFSVGLVRFSRRDL